MEWQTMPEGPEKYAAYLASRDWAVKKEAVNQRAGGKCERCGVNPPANVHHLTYIRKYEERLEDLAAWCRGCHEFTHGKTDVDPLEVTRFETAKQKPLVLGDCPGWITDDASIVICPFCSSENCHIGEPQWISESTDGNQGRITIPVSCEGSHEWDMVFAGHKGTLLAFTRNMRRGENV